MIFNEFRDLRHEKAEKFDEHCYLSCYTKTKSNKYGNHEKQNVLNPEELGDRESIYTVISNEFGNTESS